MPALVGLFGAPCSQAHVWPDPVSFNGRRGQLEVGGPYVGAVFHNGRPVPNRISFYYPVANSVDLGPDYWKRDESRPLRVAITVDREREDPHRNLLCDDKVKETSLIRRLFFVACIETL